VRANIAANALQASHKALIELSEHEIRPKCAILTRRPITPESIIRRIRQGRHGLVSINSIDVQALTTALLSVPLTRTFQAGPHKFGLLLAFRF
jgi:hypothetical protein